ncbi:MAG: hypothetical protein ABSD38_17960 [Syntrophorhabdales bacterium]|jgi:hypothetical protein
MQEQKVMQTWQGLAKSVPKGTTDADVRRCCNEDNEARCVDYPYPKGVVGMSRELPESTEHIYMSIFGDVS